MTAPRQNNGLPETVSQSSTPKQSVTIPTSSPKSREPESTNPLWVKAFLLHAPLIVIGLGLTAGLSLLAGISLNVILDPNANNPDQPAIDSATRGSDKNSVTDSTANSSANSTVTSPQSQLSPSPPSESQTTVTPDGVRIVLPADQNFAEAIPNTSQPPKTQAAVYEPSLGQDNPAISPTSSRLLLVLWSLGGICLVGAGISAWFSRRHGQESIVSSDVSSPGILALRDPSTIVLADPAPPVSTLQNLEPETIAPHSRHSLSGGDPSSPLFYETLSLPEAPEAMAFTIEYDPISDTPDLEEARWREEVRPQETVLDLKVLDPKEDGDNPDLATSHLATSDLATSHLATSDLATPDLATLMDIRKRRPRIH